jgi:hypothetical protein
MGNDTPTGARLPVPIPPYDKESYAEPEPAPVLHHYFICVAPHERNDDYLMKFIDEELAYDETGIARIVCAESPMAALRLWCEDVAVPNGDRTTTADQIVEMARFEYKAYGNQILDMWRLPDIKMRGVVKWAHGVKPPATSADDTGTEAWPVFPTEWP